MEITNNKNISISRLNDNGYNNMLYIEIIPYNREITLKYLKTLIIQIKKQAKEDFVLYANGFNFDGLYETNNLLLNDNINHNY